LLLERILDTAREAGIDGAIESKEPVLSFGLDAEGVADNLFGMPVKDNSEVKPAPGRHFDFGHVDAPELIGSISSWLWSGGVSFGFKFVVLGD